MWGGRYRPSFAHFRGHIAGDLARTLQYAVRQLEIATQKVVCITFWKSIGALRLRQSPLGIADTL